MAQAETTTATAEQLAQRWATDPRWKSIERTYTAEEVVRLSGSVREEHTLARRGAPRRRCSSGWSRRGCSAASRAGGSTPTTGAEGPGFAAGLRGPRLLWSGARSGLTELLRVLSGPTSTL